MNESPVEIPKLTEVPVPDPRAFFLRHENKGFLTGQRATPLTEQRVDSSEWAWVTVCMGGVMMGVCAIIAANGNGFQVALDVTSLVIAGVGGYLISNAGGRPPRKWPGQVLSGSVLKAEKIRIQTGIYRSESIGYGFVHPDGRTLHARAEGPTERASHAFAPLPGTPIYVWYAPDGRYFLL